MKWKSMFILLVLNIFTMLSVSVLMEYTNLSERFISIEESVQEALDSAILASVGSEEMFSEKFQAEMQSYALRSDKTTTSAVTLIWLEGDHRFYKANTYLLAYYYNTYGRFPQTMADINTMLTLGGSNINNQTGFVFEWLFGEQASDYNNASLVWGNRNTSRRQEYQGYLGSAPRTTGASSYNANFKAFYDGVGKTQLTSGYLKTKISDRAYRLELTTYPNLANMGFKWMDALNLETSLKTSDTLTSTCHVGKAINSQKKTLYYLTPASLGVTYIPTEVLKPTFIANLDSIVRLNHLGGASTSGKNEGDIQSLLKEASNCVETSVYTGGGTHQVHGSSGVGQDIVTDGLVEFDLDTVKVKVDYFYVNFGDASIKTNAQTILSKVNGAVQYYSGGSPTYTDPQSREQTLNSFLKANNDTAGYVANFGGTNLNAQYGDVKNGRIVARVTVRLKLHVPYQSGILQWMCQRTGTTHYDLKLWDEALECADVTQDGIWYQYTAFHVTSRS